MAEGQRDGVLVIDDEESIREGCRLALTDAGVAARTAQNGVEGLALVDELRPGVVLVDLKMPGLSGAEVIARVRALDPAIVAIVITGYGTVDSAVEAMKLGAYDFVCKPFGPDRLLTVVEQGLEQHRVRRRLAALEREKQAALDNFAAVVCHQLKAPAAAAAQWVDALASGRAGPLTEQQRGVVARAYERTAELTCVIGDWLRLARLESGTLALDAAPVDLGAVAEEAWQSLADQDGKARLGFEVLRRPGARPVRGDRGILRQLLANLLGNAVKFAAGPGSVTVTLSAEGRSTVVAVSDTGVGIPVEELPHLFAPFYRGARSDARRPGGYGLGLSIARRIVALHEGEICVESVPGRGTTFTLRLPAVLDGDARP